MGSDELITVDLGVKRRGLLTESWLAMFGGWVEALVKGMGGGNMALRGKRPEVEAFLDTLAREREYANIAAKHGLTDPSVLNNKLQLMKSIENFERETGIIWPIK